MGRPIDPARQERDNIIIARVRDGETDIHRLAIEYGLSDNSVYKILSGAGVSIERTEARVISDLHGKLGSYLLAVRVFDLHMSPGQLAQRANISQARLSRIESGHHNVTLHELMLIAEALSMTVPALLTAAHAGYVKRKP